MKNAIGFLLLLILLLLSACSATEHMPSYDNSSNTLPSDHPQTIVEEKTETNFIKMGKVIQIPSEELSLEDFGYGYGTPNFDVEWIDNSNAILCVYKMSDIDYAGICKIFLLNSFNHSLSFLYEQNINGSTQINSFTCDEFAYICFGSKTGSSYLKIDLENNSVATGVIDYYNPISPTGLILLKDDNEICIKKFNSDLTIHSFDIPENQTFINWSPNGEYVFFQQMDNNNEKSKYFIYNLSGSLISSFESKSDAIFKWCNNSEDIIIESYSDNLIEYHKHNIVSKKTEQIPYVENTILIESSFSLFLNQNNNTEIMLYSNPNSISTGIKTDLNYNIVAKYNCDNKTCIIEIKEDNNIYLYTVEVLMGM